MIDQPWVQLTLARVYAKLEALKLMNWRAAWSLSIETADDDSGAKVAKMVQASAVKVMGTEFFVDCYRLLLEIVGEAGIIKSGEPGTLFGGILEQAYRGATTLTFGGGVNEVQRDIIAMAGLWLPRAKRR